MQQIGIYREQLLALIRAIRIAGLSYPLLALAPNSSLMSTKNVIVPLRLEWGQNDLSCQCDIEDDDTKTSDGMIMRYG